jgi:predicted Zn finger-like uncharacterized protein
MLCSNAPELTVLESVHCPTCSTHYGLKASRVRASLRRARCFRCSSVFSIEQEVQRLLAAPEAAQPAEEMGIGPDDFLDLQSLPVDFPEMAPHVPDLKASAILPVEDMPSLTLGDLEGAEEEILEKTLVVEPAPAPQATLITAPDVADSDDLSDPQSIGGYSSARDAIAKLLGSFPTPEQPPVDRRNPNRTATQMDVEATLDALESTLGGVTAKDLETRPITPPHSLSQAEPVPSEPEPIKPASSTLKLTHDEIMSAMKAAEHPAPAPLSLPIMAPKPTAVVPSTPKDASADSEASLLKIQVGQDIYNNVSLDQIITWIEQGRIQDFHMVARQFSENWIEAGKVPSLRPVFERIRRQQAPSAQQAQAVILPPPNETTPIKKSLFGGLFNRG